MNPSLLSCLVAEYGRFFSTSLFPMLIALLVMIAATLISTKPLTEEQETDVWEKTRAVDDPLQPWPELYAE